MLDPARLPQSISSELREAALGGELPPIGASPDAMLRLCEGMPLEAVEVKNTCPFFTRSSEPGVLRAYVDYISADARGTIPMHEWRGPAEAIPAHYVPQVQLEMLVTGSRRNHFVSATASQGLNVLVMHRDDAYLSELLHFVRAFWRTVLSGTCPPPDMHWAEEQRFASFLDSTVALGKSAQKPLHVSRPWRREASAAASRLFLDPPSRVSTRPRPRASR